MSVLKLFKFEFVLKQVIFFCFCTGFRPINSGGLIRLMRKGMRTGQALFLLGIEPYISRIRLWKKFLTTRA